MYDEIVKAINERISAQPNSLAATADEVRICWLVAEVERLRELVDTAKILTIYCVSMCGAKQSAQCKALHEAENTWGCLDYKDFKKELKSLGL